MRQAAVGVLFGVVFMSVALSGSADPFNAETSQSASPILVAALNATTKGKPAGFDKWYGDLQHAKQEQKRWGKRMAIAGGATVVGSLALVAITKEPVLVMPPMLAGLGYTGYAAYKSMAAAGTALDLDQEGRIKGYLSLGPTPRGGAQLAIAIAF